MILSGCENYQKSQGSSSMVRETQTQFFVIKNWLNDSRIDCKITFEFGEVNWDGCSLEKELEEFEDSFEQDEIVDV